MVTASSSQFEYRRKPYIMKTTVTYLQKMRWLCSITFFMIFGLALQGCVPTQKGGTSLLLQPDHAKKENPYYAGYSKKYAPYRDKLARGEADGVISLLKEEDEKNGATDSDKLASKLRLVGLMERTSLFLQLGKSDKALEYASIAQEVIEERNSESYFKEGASAFSNLCLDLVGSGELGRYNAPGYEKVMLLDMASIAYLLQGDERAFNVARLAVEWQKDEKDKFGEELERMEKDSQNENKEGAKKEGSNKNTSIELIDTLHKEFAKYDKSALNVSSAFVNPFGDYVTGMVNEFKSVKLKSLISNAHIAYKQALQLNPKSKVLQKAVKDTKARKQAKNLVHIVALDGFVPEKKILSIPVMRDVDVELSTFNPIKSQVTKIKVLSKSNKTLATLSPVADIEALALRHQKDSLPYIQAMMITAATRDIALVQGGNAMLGGLGNLVKSFTDASLEPDTTSWMTLPSTVLAARIYIYPGLKTLKIRSYNNQNKMIAEKIIKLNKGDQHFVLVRSSDQTLNAYPSKQIWSSQK